MNRFMARAWVVALCLPWLTAVTARASDGPVVVPPPVTVPTLPANAQVRSFGFTHLVVKLAPGTVWSSPHGGWFCVAWPKITWKGGQNELKGGEYQDALRAEMKEAGLKVDGDPDNLFEAQASTSDLQVGGIIDDISMTYCQPNVTSVSSIHGQAVLSMQWQVYSSLQKTVLAKIRTTGGVDIKAGEPSGAEALLIGAYKANVRALIASDDFRKIILSAPAPAGELARPDKLSPLPLAGALQAGSRPIADAVASVVMVFAGETSGSAFLVSSDGLLMTDRHVVGDAKFVKVRWPDGIETLGEVVRGDKTRDVALVKTDPRGRRPLKLRRDPPQPGDEVYAIGAPLDQKFQSTVTRGVVSANRTFEGLAFIQSDVSVNPGNSGGPLLDDKGQVLGMTESGLRISGAPAGINLFTPIGDALDFLAAEPK